MVSFEVKKNLDVFSQEEYMLEIPDLLGARLGEVVAIKVNGTREHFAKILSFKPLEKSVLIHLRPLEKLSHAEKVKRAQSSDRERRNAYKKEMFEKRKKKE